MMTPEERERFDRRGDRILTLGIWCASLAALGFLVAGIGKILSLYGY